MNSRDFDLAGSGTLRILSGAVSARGDVVLERAHRPGGRRFAPLRAGGRPRDHPDDDQRHAAATADQPGHPGSRPSSARQRVQRRLKSFVGDLFKKKKDACCLAFVLATAGIVLAIRLRAARRSDRELTALLHQRTAQLTEALDRVEQLATTDPLTGIANRRRFAEFLQREWKRALRSHTPITLVMVDVDFKRFNDSHGHLRAMSVRRGRRPADGRTAPERSGGALRG